jgi:hypothetical protein
MSKLQPAFKALLAMHIYWTLLHERKHCLLDAAAQQRRTPCPSAT